MNYVKSILFLILVSVTFLMPLKAQEKSPMDTVISLKTFTIQDKREIKFATGGKVDQVDSMGIRINKTLPLDELLINQSRVLIKSYGAGSLATSSIRGAGAAHTAVLWNGFNIQSPSHGVVDLSLMPVSFIDDISLQTGNLGALWGSGAIGGAIHIRNLYPDQDGFSAGITSVAGSFNEKQQHLNLSVKPHKKITSTLRLHYKSSDNDFIYKNITASGHPLQKQRNAGLLQKGILQENYIDLFPDQKLNIRLWYQKTDRNIPPVMSATVASLAAQEDNALRLTSEWSKKGRSVVYFIRSAYFIESIEYTDDLFKTYSNSNVISSISEAEANVILTEKQLLNVGFNNTYNEVVSSGYKINPRQNRGALFGSYKIYDKKQNWQCLVNIRQELVTNKVAPFIPAAGIEGNIIKSLKIKANVSRSYRIPTFNDFYWNPGGNRDLLPETGWGQEAGLILNKQEKEGSAILELTFYNRNIKNWIIWLPQENYWMPQNIMQVWSRGTETSFQIKFNVASWKFKISTSTNYTVSTNEKAKTANDASIGKQLIYTPLYSGNGNFSITHRNWDFNFSHQYTGYRYTSSDNLEFLNPYHYSSLYLSKNIRLNKFKTAIFIRVNNLLNADYQVIALRPMPGRHYQAGLTIKFN